MGQAKFRESRIWNWFLSLFLPHVPFTGREVNPIWQLEYGSQCVNDYIKVARLAAWNGRNGVGGI